LKLLKGKISRELNMSETLKAVEAAAYRLAKAQAKKAVIERSLNGIIVEQERRAAVKAAAAKTKDLQS
jgi:hypothetical protein